MLSLKMRTLAIITSVHYCTGGFSWCNKKRLKK